MVQSEASWSVLRYASQLPSACSSLRRRGNTRLCYPERKADAAESSDGMNCRSLPGLAKSQTSGTPHCRGHICMGSAQPTTATPHPSPESTNKSSTGSGREKRRQSDGLAERGEQGGCRHSGKPPPLPAAHTSQLVALQGSPSLSLCSAEGNGHVSGERHLCCAGAGASPDLEALEVRAEALLAGRGEQGAGSEQGGCTAGGDRQQVKSTLPSSSDTSSFPLPTHAAGWRCPCQDLFPCHHLSSLSKLPDRILSAACSALPCRYLPGTGHCTGTAWCLQALNSRSDQP